ncbi:lipocalin family protein [Phaeodactylibacter sp.]|jgi:hypothetical protein|uniref:lipocalin family protein n=1 Tax=Phaeodactylibacter sp. TaxID=1940289 RepID=UPI0025DDDBA1|nr:lipocalin family protein [Phaeodactylibacter sp.]MCI4647309.1 lipocalin family protein [Phaeodactylibacter sp.]MCI5089398.1 lipocalin family protein [Phaeodactylibacter sp.]
MNSMRISNSFMRCIGLMLLMVSCAEEPQNIQELLPGRWELQQATRNGEPTRSLADLYYEFDADGTMRTNLPVAKGESAYQISGQSIEQNQDGNIIAYSVTSITDSTLVLQTELRNTPFQFNLQRAIPNQE